MTNFLSQAERDHEWIDAETVEKAGVGFGLSGMWRGRFEKLVAAKRELDTQLNQRPGVIASASAEYSHDPRLHGAHASRAQYVDSRLRSLGIPPLMNDESQSINATGGLV